MNDNFDNQKGKLLSIKHEISLLQQQVNYLLRNGKALGLLDLDVLMNRTHTIYDQLCAINLGEETVDDDFELDPEALSGLFGVAPEAETSPEVEPEPQTIVEEEEMPVEEEETPMEEPETPIEEFPEMPQSEEVVMEHEVEAVEETVVEPEEAPEAEKLMGDEFGFFFRFEDLPPTEEKNEPVEPEPVEIESLVTEPVENELVEDKPTEREPIERDGKIIHFVEEIPEDMIPERDRMAGDELVLDNPFEMPQVEHEPEDFVEEQPAEAPFGGFEEVQPEDEIPVSDVLTDFYDKDDSEFELFTPETLGESLMGEDNSLAAKLQQNPVRDLKSVIGINDKFLFVNELFGGSMEKYNRSIDNLNDLKTLNGAMIYLNELKVELQWNSSNEAYRKLTELVARKFE